MRVPPQFYVHLQRSEPLDPSAYGQASSGSLSRQPPGDHAEARQRRASSSRSDLPRRTPTSGPSGTFRNIPGRIVAARALDPADGRVVQAYIVGPSDFDSDDNGPDKGLFGREHRIAAAQTESPPRPQVDLTSTARSPAGPEPLTRWRVVLLTLRHFPELTDKVILDFATRLIQDEQSIWARLDS